MDTSSPRAVVLSGAHGHSCDRTSARVIDELRPLVPRIDLVTHPDYLTPETLAACDLLIWNCNRWTMYLEKYAADRAEWGYHTAASFKQAVTTHLDLGKGLLALHTAPISFDDWPEAYEIVGARWHWGQSSHPPFEEFTVDIAQPDHPFVRGLSAFKTVDELYASLDLRAPVDPILTAICKGQAQPVLWQREHRKGRVVVSVLGHEPESYDAPEIGEIYRRAAAWLLKTERAG